jgi:GEVED domain/Secretion system C-terminal sorting domain
MKTISSMLLMLICNFTIANAQCGNFFISASKDSVCAKESFTMQITQCDTNSLLAVYATSSASNVSDGDIGKVRLNNGINNSTCNSIAPGVGSLQNKYSNYMPNICFANVSPGTTVPLEINIITCGSTSFTYGAAMFIDFNHDGILSAVEKVFSSNLVLIPATLVSSAFIPFNALPGKTLMRVVTEEGVSGNNISSSGGYNWGETEDYTINIIDSASIAAGAITTFSWFGSASLASLNANNAMVVDSNKSNATNYMVVATSPGCIDTIYKTIYPKANNTVVYLNLSAVNSTSLPGNGSISIVPFGGTSPYTFGWSPITSTNSSINNLAAGIYVCTITDAKGCITSDSITILQLNNTSIGSTFKDKQAISIQPNPANNIVTISSKNVFNNVIISNALGVIVFNNIYQNTSKAEIDISRFSNGLYFVKTNNSTVQKLNIIR